MIGHKRIQRHRLRDSNSSSSSSSNINNKSSSISSSCWSRSSIICGGGSAIMSCDRQQPHSWIIWLTVCAGFQLLVGATSGFNPGIIEGDTVVSIVEVVQGNTARIPCDVTPASDKDDQIRLVIWYKDAQKTPIYSFDARDKKVETGNHWSDVQVLNGRGFFDPKGAPAMLAIETSKSSDSGSYRCRVDFQHSPTRNTHANLTVIIPPDNVLILDERGAHITHYILGPYNEGSKVSLTCVSTGGRPQPRLTWWRENSLLDDSFIAMTEKKVKNVLHLDKLERHHLHSQYTCQASNNNVTTPISSAVTINLNLRPLWVKMQGENKPLSAGGSYGLVCEVVGSRPTPVITWWKGSILMKNSTDSTSADGNMTTSTLTFTPTIDDSGKYLSCRAEQPLIPDSGLESGWKLDIHHVPVVTLELGSNLNSTSTIREGADVYFECNIKSNPWVYKVSWRHNGRFLYNNAAAGIIVANQSLVLQNVTRARSGPYTCIGSNEEGDGESNTMHLDIKFAPLCRLGQIQTYNIARQETAKIVCELESNPNDVHFTWKFNTSSAENLDLPASLIAVDRAKSIAHYTPMTEQDYGTLMCWGTNDIGAQSEPCIFDINPAGKPDALSNCTVSNQTANVLQLECIEGFDGGLPQTFEVDVYYSRTKNLVTNQSSNVPVFVLKGLHPDFGYDIVLTAKNAKGRSAEVVHHMNTLNGAEKHTDEFPSLDFLLPYTGNKLQTKLLLGAAGGLVFAIMLLFLAVGLVVRCRRNRRAARSTELSGGPDDGAGVGVAIATGDGLSSAAGSGGGGGVGGLGVLPVGALGHGGVVDVGGDIMGPRQSTLIGGGGGGGGAKAKATAETADMLMGPGKSGYGDVTKLRGLGGFQGGAESMDGFDSNPDIIPLKGKDDGYFDQRNRYGGWNYPGQAYATVAMNSQFENNRIKYDGIKQQPPDCQQQQRHYLMSSNSGGGPGDPVSVAAANTTAPVPTSDMMNTAGSMVASSHHHPHQQHQQQQQHPMNTGQSSNAYIGNNTSLFDPMADNQNKEVTYAALAMAGNPKPKTIYTSATLGRQRNKASRVNEPTIYAQIDLAHGGTPPTMHNHQQQSHSTTDGVVGILGGGGGGGYPAVSWVSTPRQVHQLLQSKPMATTAASSGHWNEAHLIQQLKQQQHLQHPIVQQQPPHQHHQQQLQQHQQHQQQQQQQQQRHMPIMCSKESNPSSPHQSLHNAQQHDRISVGGHAGGGGVAGGGVKASPAAATGAGGGAIITTTASSTTRAAAAAPTPPPATIAATTAGMHHHGSSALAAANSTGTGTGSSSNASTNIGINGGGGGGSGSVNSAAGISANFSTLPRF